MTEEIKEGAVIYQSGKMINEIAVVKSGEVSVSTPCGDYTVGEGGILGICELASALHYYTYTAAAPTVIEKYPYKKADLNFITDKIPDIIDSSFTSGIDQINNITAIYTIACMGSSGFLDFLRKQYVSYTELCVKLHLVPQEMPELDELEAPDCNSGRCRYISGYYNILKQIMEGNIFVTQPDFVDGFMRHLSNDAEELFRNAEKLNAANKKVYSLIVSEDGDDLLGYYTEILSYLTHGNPAVKNVEDAVAAIKTELGSQCSMDTAVYKNRIEQYETVLTKLKTEKKTHNTENDEEIILANTKVANSLDTILLYADCGSDISATFKAAIKAYKGLPDCDSMDDSVSKLRHTISNLFYQIYMHAFQVSIGGGDIPVPVRMFLDFGYVDEELAGIDNAECLAKIVSEDFDAPEYQIFSFYDWLLAIYHGERMPSRNEFDMDFTESVHAKRMKGEIDKETEVRFMNDRAQMVLYELQNMFPSADKMTYGRITIFTGVFAEKDIIGDLASNLVTVSKISEILEDVRRRDFSVFYRDTLYTNPDVGINKDFIHVEVLPDIILMPVVGTRGVMWQEIEGKKRLSQGRIMLPVFMLEDLKTVFTHTIGEFRWEMCKRMQGAFWNDITDPSLTSEYFDYVQFYKKNQELSQDMKDKLKISLAKAKNSYKEMFVRDYITWIMFESEGLPRLNKVARGIVFKYCPFNKEIRGRLKSNPMYENELRYYDLHSGQKKHHFKNVVQEISNLGKEIPREISDEIKYLEM